MIEVTLDRLDDFIPPERRLIVTHALQKEKTEENVGKKCPRILGEPLPRNTAAALALAALELKLCFPEERDMVMVSLHADHVIQDRPAFLRTLRKAITVAKAGYLTLLGVVPTSPETGYGYVQKGSSLTIPEVDHCFSVMSFKEKPDLATAQQYLAQKEFYWNSGLFVWRVDKILSEFEAYLPNVLGPLQSLAGELEKQGRTFSHLTTEEFLRVYEKVPEISIDNGILERSRDIAVVECDCGWQDIGTWTALPSIMPADSKGNIAAGENMLLDTKDSIICSDSYFVATIGIENLIVVVDKGCVLVCKKDRAQDIKLVVSELKKRGLERLT